EWYKRNAEQQQQISPKQTGIVVCDVTEDAVMLDPHQSDDQETDHESRDSREKFNQGVSQPRFGMFGEMRHFQLEHEQRDHDRKHSVAKKDDTLEAQTCFGFMFVHRGFL